jgi:uroporphyrinogen decarboxylase
MYPAPIDLVNWIGRKKTLRLLGLLVSSYLARKSLTEIAAISGRRIGVPIFGAHQGQLNGTSVKQNMTDGRIMFETIEKFITTHKPDLVMCTMPDLSAEAEACGCKVKIPEDAMPSVVEHLPIETVEDVKKLKIPDPFTAGRLPVFIEATKLFKKRFALLQMAVSSGPFTLAAELLGVDIIARKIFKDPPLVHALMQYSLNVILRHSRALIEAGAAVIGLGDPTCSLLSAKAYAEFILPYHQQYVKEIPVPVIIHVCGTANHLVELICKSGSAGVSLDSPTDVTQLKDRVPANTVIFGNLSPVDVLLFKKPAEVRTCTHALMQEMKDFPNYAVMSGCDLPVNTPIENVGAMVKAIKEFKPN